MQPTRRCPADYIPDDDTLKSILRRRFRWDFIDLLQEIWPDLAWGDRFPSALYSRWIALHGLTAAQWLSLKLLMINPVNLSVSWAGW